MRNTMKSCRWKHYLQIDVVATSREDFIRWFGYVESKFRQLPLMYVLDISSTLEILWRLWPSIHACDDDRIESRSTPQLAIEAYPYPDTFASNPENPHQLCFFVALKLDKTSDDRTSGEYVNSNVDLTPAIREFSQLLMLWEKRGRGMDLSVTYLASGTLPAFVRTPSYNPTIERGQKRHRSDEDTETCSTSSDLWTTYNIKSEISKRMLGLLLSYTCSTWTTMVTTRALY